MAKYKVLVGIDYPPNRRAEAGDIVEDFPSKSIAWCVEQGFIELVKSSNAPVESTDSNSEEG